MLISFLELYGVYFNYVKLGIRVQTPHQPDRPAGFIDKEELFKNFCCGHRTISNLCIVDPFNDSNKNIIFSIHLYFLFSSRK
jgi:DNA polymerase sigma